MAPVPCLEYDENQCNKQEGCVSVILYKKINDAINSVIDTVTLADMYSWQKELTVSESKANGS